MRLQWKEKNSFFSSFFFDILLIVGDRMKKILPILVLLAFVAFCYQIVVTFFITEHEITYSLIANDQKHYTVSENYEKENNRNYYSFLIRMGNKNKVFSLSLEEDFNKQERVITDIKYYKKNNLECIFPIYKRNHTADVACLLDGTQVSSSYLVDKKNADFSYISKKFSADGYEDFYYTVDFSGTKEENSLIFYDYIPKDYVFAIWNYDGITIVSSKSAEKKIFLNEDHYENTLSIGVGKYYVTVNTDDEDDQLNYYQLIVYNLIDGGKTVVDVDISQDSYFNGVSDGLLYITDPKVKKQYTLNPSKKEFKEISNFYEVSNSRLKKVGRDIFDFPRVDSLRVSNKKITKMYNTTDIRKNRDDYYFMTENRNIYRVIQGDYKHPILICQFDNIKEWQVHDDGVSFIVGDTLYLYTDVYGLKPILKNPEFQYNSKNIYYFVRGE